MKSLHDPHIVYRRHAETVMELEHDAVRDDGHGHTHRYKMAEGMLQVLDHMAHKRSLVIASELRKQIERERIMRIRAMLSELFDDLNRIERMINVATSSS